MQANLEEKRVNDPSQLTPTKKGGNEQEELK